MLSFRRLLQQWPTQARLFVLALALLQFVAPTWHVCEMGGHVMSMQGMAGHGDMAMAAAAETSGPRRALICYCAARPTHHVSPNTPQVSATPSQHDMTCLAMLLQSMPGHVSAAATLPLTYSVSFLPRPAVVEEFPTLAVIRHFRGRAPPLAI